LKKKVAFFLKPHHSKMVYEQATKICSAHIMEHYLTD